MKNMLLFLIFMLCCFSCASQRKEVITKSAIKLEGKKTKIRDLLGIDGYFSFTDEGNLVIDNNNGNLIFFEDGSYVWQFRFKDSVTLNNIKNNIAQCIFTWNEDDQIRWGNYWGVYEIRNDTIITNFFIKGTLLGRSWSLTEERYKIINRNTIRKIYIKGLLKADESYYSNKSPWINGEKQIFTPVDPLPSSDNWLKEEKWIWRNESDWKAYMERIKAEKQKNKKK